MVSHVTGFNIYNKACKKPWLFHVLILVVAFWKVKIQIASLRLPYRKNILLMK